MGFGKLMDFFGSLSTFDPEKIKEEAENWNLCPNCGIPFRKSICPICGLKKDKEIIKTEVKDEKSVQKPGEKPREKPKPGLINFSDLIGSIFGSEDSKT